MRVVLAPDKFKGCLTAAEVASAVAGGITDVRSDAEMIMLPVADGGDGTVAAALTAGYTKISECRDGAVNTFYLHPADVGLAKAAAGALKGATAQDNAQIIERVLAGERGPARDVVLLNAGAQLLLKAGTNALGVLTLSRDTWPHTLARMATESHFILGVVCYGLSLFVWILGLSRVPVSVAYPLLSIGYVINAIAAHYMFGEAIGVSRWLGIGFIVLGVWLVARS